MRAAVMQLAAGLDSGVNRDEISMRLEGLPQGLDLVVLPEAAMCDFGSPRADLSVVAEPLDGPFFAMLSAQARRRRTTVIAGMFEKSDGLPFNTLMVVGPEGDLEATYRKVHLYDSFGYQESTRLAPGSIEPTVIQIADLRVGLMTCYDLRFPEMARLLVDEGAELMVVPAAWVAGAGKLRHWRALLAARAIENTAFVVAAAQSGPRYTGHSLVLDAGGSIVGEAGHEDETLIVDLSAADLQRMRVENPSLNNRRIRTAP